MNEVLQWYFQGLWNDERISPSFRVFEADIIDISTFDDLMHIRDEFLRTIFRVGD